MAKKTSTPEPEEPLTHVDKGIHKVFHGGKDEKPEEKSRQSKPVASAKPAGKPVDTAALSRMVTRTLLVLSVVATAFIGWEIKKEWQTVQPTVLPDTSPSLAITTPPPQGMVIAGSTLPQLSGRVYHRHDGLGVLIGHSQVIVEQKNSQLSQPPLKLRIDQVAMPQSDGLFHVNDLSLGVSGVFDIHAFLVEKSVWEPWSRDYDLLNREPLTSLPKSLDHKVVRVKTGTPGAQLK
ncbi:MAG: hypothetical protein HQL58_06180 [Magnetococcales bacterium]|nr:hypothetical protein [Magnetococcales bacterium]